MPFSLLCDYTDKAVSAVGLQCWCHADEKVDAAATVLRMLFIRDLRTLQTHIDDAIVEVQV